ncbi:MAG: hypothetical protein ISS57_16365 [Anaerolineales bacterium]|nr:hypothetical protein [Anaerolineales bacterium]
MEEIRCPMCGNPNPDHLENCQHCQARLKPLVISSEDGPPGGTTDADSGLPDWMRSEQQDETPSEDESPPEADSEGDDWLTRLREEGDSAPVEITPPSEPAESKEPEDEDWLQRIREMRDEDVEPPEDDDSSSIFDGALPSWMTDEEPAAEKEIPAQGASIPDWISTSDKQAEKRDTSAGTDDSELPDLFSSSDEDEAPAAPSQDADTDIPDWLSTLGEGGESASPQVEPTEEELPSWFTDAQDDAAPSSAEPSLVIPEPTPEPDSELPDWLKDSAESVEPLPSVESTKEEIPDWMTTVSEEPSAEPEAEIPEWLLTVEDVEPGATPGREPADNGIPDWMSGVDDEDAEAEPEISTIPAEADPETPDWLSGLDAEELSWPADSSDAETPGEDLEPDWLEKIGEGAAPDLVPDDDGLSPFLTDDGLDESLFEIDELSDLLSEVGEDLKLPEVVEDDDGLAPAELPSWLEAMRPVESAEDDASTLDQGQIEQTGPLAGLSGVLMAEPEIARLKQTPKLTSRLQVTEAQKNHIKVFRDLLATERQAQPLLQPIVVSSQGLLRWLSAFFLILVIGLVIINESQLVPSPPLVSVPTEVLRISELIDTIASQDPVLVSFDYEPGTSGEMDAAAAAVVDHLMIRGAYLTLVSTAPTGPALAEHFIATVQAEHNYISGNQYINLGYVPGGASGLLGFVQMPQRITPLSFDGMDAWTTQPLNGIYSLADFKLVLVITDNPDTARTWIEQVQPKLQDTPLITVVSAQAEPILHPYVGGENAQVRGMVGGIIGGAAYEQVTGKPNLARIYWDALNFGLMTAIAAILIGGIVNAFSILFRSKDRREA